jgi:hypothetical protein
MDVLQKFVPWLFQNASVKRTTKFMDVRAFSYMARPENNQASGERKRGTIHRFFFIYKKHMPGFINKAPKDQMIARFGHYRQGTGTASSTRGETNIVTPKTNTGVLHNTRAQ